MKYTVENIDHPSVCYHMDEDEAAAFLRLSIKTLRDKAWYGDLIRQQWKATPEEPIPETVKSRTAWTEDETKIFCAEWREACDRLAAAAGTTLNWAGE